MNVIPFPQVLIEPINHDTLDAAASLMTRSWSECYAAHTSEQVLLEKTEEYFRQYLVSKQNLTWVARMSNKTAGLVSVGSNCVEEIWVDRRFQRKGLGTKLIQRAFEHFRTRGFTSAQAGVEDFNQAGCSFFQGLGWKQVGSEPVQLAPGRYANALVYCNTVPKF